MAIDMSQSSIIYLVFISLACDMNYSSSMAKRQMSVTQPLDKLVPEHLRALDDPARDLPRIAKDPPSMALIAAAVEQVPSHHQVLLGDARRAVLPPSQFTSSLRLHRTGHSRSIVGPQGSWAGSPTTTNSSTSWTPFGAYAIGHSCPVAGLSAWSVMYVCPGEEIAADIPWCPCTPRFRTAAGDSDSTTWPRSSGTRSPTSPMRCSEALPGSWASPTNPTP